MIKSVRPINLIIFFFVISGCKQYKDEYSTWAVYKGDAGSHSYSSLSQINRDNVGQLQEAWVFQPDDTLTGHRFGKYECNPIVIGEIMYVTSPRLRLYAIDATNGKKIWSYNPFDGKESGRVSRGVSYWADGDDRRILFTAGEYLCAVDAYDGTPVTDFGENGRVRLDTGLGRNPDDIWVIPTSPGIIYRDLIILGAEVSESYVAAPGDIRAFNVRTGNLEWTFHTIPHPGEAGYETWPEGAWKYAGGANNWGGMSLDRKKGMVYVPLGSPTYDYYGANRHGKNLYGNCVVALEAMTGRLIWHFQTVHHDLWDYDLPAPPCLITIKKAGKRIDALAQPSKTGFLYVLDRETGMPVFPVEERKVPVSHIPGEETWPTQPFPVKPEAFSRQAMTNEDLTLFGRASHDSLLVRFRELRNEGMFTPPDTSGSLMLPGSRGGSEWGGAAVDPNSGVIYINANESPEIATLRKVSTLERKENQTLFKAGEAFYMQYCMVCHGKERQGQDPDFPALTGLKNRMSPREALARINKGSGRMPSFGELLTGHEREIIAYLFGYIPDKKVENTPNDSDTASTWRNITAYGFFRDAERRPALKPPWGTLNAINLNSGEYTWSIPLGNEPALQQGGEPPTGMENWGGPIVTAGGLVFIAATRDHKFRAFDKHTGDLLWKTDLPGSGYAIPATYMAGGRQYVVISVTNRNNGLNGCVIAFTLPFNQ